MSGISIFDKTAQNFGRLDETIQVSRDNALNINDEVTTELIYEDYEGDVKKKGAINIKGLTFNNDFAEIVSLTTIKGLLDFDGVDDYVQLSSVPDISGSYTIGFSVYWSNNFQNSTTAQRLFEFLNIASDRLTIILDASTAPNRSIRVFTDVEQKYYYINNLTVNTIENRLDFLISITNGTINLLTINGQTQTADNTSSGGLSGVSGATIGANYSLNSFYDSLIWDLFITSRNSYLGQPNGNQNMAWVDQTGTANGTVNGSPSTIDITQ